MGKMLTIHCFSCTQPTSIKVLIELFLYAPGYLCKVICSFIFSITIAWALMPLWDVICFLQILFIFEPLLCRKWFPFWLTCADTVSFHRINPWPDQPIITNQINQSQLTKSTNHNCLVISLLTVALKQNNDENNYTGFNLKNRIRSFKAITTPDCKTTTNCRYFLAWITHLQAIFT